MNEVINFTNPPVTETMLGVWFSPLSWNASLFGLYRRIIRGEYPHFEDAMPIIGGPGLSLFPPTQRGIYFSEARDLLVQVQPTMFYLNWRRLGLDQTYPRYREQLDRFLHEWNRFRSFLAQETIPLPIISTCQVSYINHIAVPFGKAHGSVITAFLSGAAPFLADASQLNLSGNYHVGDGTDLNVQIVPVLRAADNREMVQFTLTANRTPDLGDTEAMATAFNRAHDSLIQSFMTLTSDEARLGWGQQ